MVKKIKQTKKERLKSIEKIANIKKISIFSVIGIFIVAGILFSFSGVNSKNSINMNDEMMAKHISLSASDKKLTLYKDPNCGCCGGYADELRRQGFDVTIVKESNMDSIKKKYGISKVIESCHTSVFENGYIVEGHTPIEAVMKMLDEKPKISGIGMGGMPAGSVGMPGQKREEFKIYTIEKNSNNLYMTV